MHDGHSTPLQALLEPVVAGLGYELIALEHITGGQRSVVRLYIDAASGIRVEDCERVSRQVSAVLDVEDPISGEYVLEVSSPGLDRPLTKRAHFEQFIGSHAKVQLSYPLAGNTRRNYSGEITGVSVDAVLMRCEAEHEALEVALPLKQIAKAKLVPSAESLRP